MTTEPLSAQLERLASLLRAINSYDSLISIKSRASVLLPRLEATIAALKAKEAQDGWSGSIHTRRNRNCRCPRCAGHLDKPREETMTHQPDQRKALEEAFRAIYPEPHFITDGPADWGVWGARRDRFTAMLDAGAWLSAAEMLLDGSTGLDEVSLTGIRGTTRWCATVWAGSSSHDATGPTPALALLSAILAARHNNGDTQ